MMDGKDMRRCSHEAMMPCAPVYFKDKEGKIHPVESFMRCSSECGTINLLLESGALVADFGELVTQRPPQELTDYLNELYEQEKNKKKKKKVK